TAVLDHSLREVRKGASSAISAFEGRTTIASNAALNLLDQNDYATLSAYAEETLRRHQSLERRVMLASGRMLQVYASPTYEGGESIGTILRLKSVPSDSIGANTGSPVHLTAFDHLVGCSNVFRKAIE